MGKADGMGPIDYLVVEFPGSRLTGKGFPMLVDLVERGIIRIIDLIFVKKETDGTVRGLAIADLDHDGELDLAVFEGASSGLLGQNEMDEAGEALEPGNSAAILIYENLWAAPFASRCARAAPSWSRPAVSRRRTSSRRSTPPSPSCSRHSGGNRTMGLLRGVARTAVVAGTATAVSNRVSRRQAGGGLRRSSSSTTSRPISSSSTSSRRAPAGNDMDYKLDQLRQLADLKAQGVLSESEFEVQKARLLGS
jgi:hypothetical protein